MDQRKRKAPPSFDFFFNDWIGGTMRMTHMEQACFLRLLLDQWQRGFIPSRDAQRMAVCGITCRDQWAEVWESLKEKFVTIRAGDLVDFSGDNPDEMVSVNPRMHRDRQRSLPTYWHNCNKNRKNGSLGGRPPGGVKSKEKPSGLASGLATGNPDVNPNVNPMGTPQITHAGRGKREESLEDLNLSENRTRTVCVLEDSTRETPAPTEPAQATPTATSTHRRSRESQEFFRADFLPETHRSPEMQAAWQLWLNYVLDRDGRLVGASVDAWAMDAGRRDPATAAERLRESVTRLARAGPFWSESTGARAAPSGMTAQQELEAKVEAMRQKMKQRSEEVIHAR